MHDKYRLTMACPHCGKRSFDSTGIPAQTITVTLKCPNCTNLVAIPITEEHVLKRPPGDQRKRVLIISVGKGKFRFKQDASKIARGNIPSNGSVQQVK